MTALATLRRAALLLTLALGAGACTVRIGPDASPAPRDERPRDAMPSIDLTPRDGAPAAGASLLIPVRGIRPHQLRDTFADARSGGRTHRAIDIMAPRGTPVVAAADGTIHRLRTGGLGGITIYQLSGDGRIVYYYAHLERYAAGLREGMAVRRGEVIAYVGDTGNAGRGNYHLHFAVTYLRDPARYWEGDNVNPFPLLVGDTRAHPARDRDR